MTNSLHSLLPKKEFETILNLAQSIRNHGGNLYLVGGCVRDLSLQIQVNELDVEVFGLTPSTLEPLIKPLGGLDPVGKVFGIYKFKNCKIDLGLPRKEHLIGQRHQDFATIIEPDLSIEEAASRRDFTMNAIYLDPLTGKQIDPYNGLNDLKNGILRHCSFRFQEDPLRVLRGMQFIGRFALKPAPETVEICRQMTPIHLPKERFLAEWEKLICQSITPSLGLEFLRECGWLDYFPELKQLIDCPQDPEWHPEGDVWRHTLHCMDAFAKTKGKTTIPDTLIIGMAVLCHDFGKPSTTQMESGRWHAYGHEKAGVEPTRQFCERIGIPKAIQGKIENLVENHMRPEQLYRQKSGTKAIRRLAADVERIDWLLAVNAADSAGRPPLPSNADAVTEWILTQAKRLDIAKSKPIPLIQGRDLINLGLTPGPHFKEILNQAYEEQLNETFENAHEAGQWLEHFIKTKML